MVRAGTGGRAAALKSASSSGARIAVVRRAPRLVAIGLRCDPLWTRGGPSKGLIRRAARSPFPFARGRAARRRAHDKVDCGSTSCDDREKPHSAAGQIRWRPNRDGWLAGRNAAIGAIALVWRARSITMRARRAQDPRASANPIAAEFHPELRTAPTPPRCPRVGTDLGVVFGRQSGRGRRGLSSASWCRASPSSAWASSAAAGRQLSRSLFARWTPGCETLVELHSGATGYALKGLWVTPWGTGDSGKGDWPFRSALPIT